MTLAVVFTSLLFLGVPVALVLALSALAYIFVSGNDVLFLSYPEQLFGGLEKYGLLAIPLFMLVGEVMNEGGITRRLIGFASVFIGSVRGGLAYINLIANMMLAAIVGSANAQIAVMGQIMVPEMERQGYSRAFAAATTAAGGLMAPIIPPSMLFVVFGVLAQISIGDLFVAGIIPGLMMAVAFIAVVAVIGAVRGLPSGRRLSREEKIDNILWGLPALIVPAVIVGGILFGVTTPTEAAALGIVAAAAVGALVYREFRVDRLGDMLVRMTINASIVLFLVAAANVFGWVIVFEQVPQNVAAWLQSLTDDPLTYLLLVNALLLFVGMVIDGIAALIILVPILLPIAQTVYGIDPFQFGVVICLNLVLGLLTPPVGAGLFVAARVSGEKPGAIFKAFTPFLVATAAVLLAITVFPALTTALIAK
ncbi:TRAP transporter large permease [Azospirillum sp. ST 5-10]|uniref:TRAP transporter large permease n=1 Tax=unclassified Azospirillum TaxID=2630922 RepID=UPI003F4A3A42